MQLFREDKDAWLVPVMCGMVHNLRDVARQADAETRRGGKSSDALDNCGTLMQSCFRTALQATGAPSSPYSACADGSKALAGYRCPSKLFSMQECSARGPSHWRSARGTRRL